MTRLSVFLVTLLSATAQANPLDVQLVPTGIAGQQKPAIVVVAHRAAKELHIALKRTGCGPDESVALTLDKLAAGSEHRFDLEQPLGRCSYQGELSAAIDGQRPTMPLSFDATFSGPPEVTVVPNGFDRETHTLHVRFNREADHGTVEAFGEGGKPVGAAADFELGDEKPDEPLALTYPSEPVFRLRVTIFDPSGMFASVDLFPWELRIPHQEIVFPNGSAEITAGEQPKLEESLKEILAGAAKAGGKVPARLFVAGYTDTVGSAEANQKLSEARAQSIGRFFKQHGLRIPVLTAGLGEEALAVPTPDETAEPRNRRAEYILSVDPPAIEGAAAPAWNAL